MITSFNLRSKCLIKFRSWDKKDVCLTCFSGVVVKFLVVISVIGKSLEEDNREKRALTLFVFGLLYNGFLFNSRSTCFWSKFVRCWCAIADIHCVFDCQFHTWITATKLNLKVSSKFFLLYSSVVSMAQLSIQTIAARFFFLFAFPLFLPLLVHLFVMCNPYGICYAFVKLGFLVQNGRLHSWCFRSFGMAFWGKLQMLSIHFLLW